MLLNRRQYLIKERVAFAKLTDTYDIFDPESGQQIGLAREEPPGWAKYARLLINKQFLPTAINVYEGTDGNSAPVLSLRKSPGFLRQSVTVADAKGTALGHFKSKVFSFGGGFTVYDVEGGQVANVKGDWKGWNFRFLDNEQRELGMVTKKWAGIGKELFTSADNYIISLPSDGFTRPEHAALLLVAGLAIDVVFKEGK